MVREPEMFEKMPHIKEEVYLEFLGRTIDIHWNYQMQRITFNFKQQFY